MDLHCSNHRTYVHLCVDCQVMALHSGRYRGVNRQAPSYKIQQLCKSAIEGDPEAILEISRMGYGDLYDRVTLEMNRQRRALKSTSVLINGANATKEPILNAQKPFNAVEQTDLKPATFKLYKVIRIKPCSGKAAKLLGGWFEREWKMYSLRYSPEYVILNHRGEVSPKIKSWHLAKQFLSSLDFEVY